MASTAEVFPDAVDDALSGILAEDLFGGWRREGVSVQGARPVLSLRFDHQECSRRRKMGLGAVTSPDALNLLLALPVGEPVPLAALTHSERRVLRSVPRGAVRFGAGVVVRCAVPPVEVGLAVVGARSWRRGLESAGRFAPFCARAMVLRKPPRHLEELRMEADFYGVGVIVATGRTGPDLLVPPASFRRSRFTVAGWRFLEEVYRQIR
jgi:hypothetical protein